MVPPAKRYRYDPYPRTFKFAKVAPMAAMDTAVNSRGRSSGRYSSRSSYRSGRSGPYQALVQNNFHTHPVYPRPEVKTSDVNQLGAAFTGATVPTPIGSAGTVSVLNALAQGGEINARIGQQVSTRNCSYRYELDLPVLPADQVPTSGRVMLIWDRQPNSAVAAFTDIFTSASYLAYVLPGGAQRFVILRNQQFSLSPNGDQTLFFEGYIKINMTSTYAPETVSNNPVSGALLLAFIADQTAAANRPTISGCFRTRFIDN